MAKPYFRQVPDLEYIDRSPGDQTIGNYSKVKNLFKRAQLRQDIFGDLSFFTKYKIIGNERPDSVAYKFYNDPTLDWMVLLANNIINVQTEWPLNENSFYNFLIDKYETEEKIHSTHHYESIQIKNSAGVIMMKEGLTIEQDFSLSYFDKTLAGITTATNMSTAITNYEYETKLQDEKRNIFVLKPRYLQTIYDDLDGIMSYKKGSTQYVSKTLVRGENIRLYQ